MLARATTAAPCRGASTETNQQRKSRNVHVLAASIYLSSRQVQLHEISSCSMTGRRESDPDALMSASDLRIRLRSSIALPKTHGTCSHLPHVAAVSTAPLHPDTADCILCYRSPAHSMHSRLGSCSDARQALWTVLRSAGNGCIREQYRAFAQSSTEDGRVSCHRIDAADMVTTRAARPSRPSTCAAPYPLCCSACCTSNVTSAEHDANACRSQHADQGPSTLTNYISTSLLYIFELDMYFFPWSLIVLDGQMNALVLRPPSIRSMHDDRCLPVTA